MLRALSIDRKRLGDLCRQHGIRRLSVFGSAIRQDFEPGSDVDLLVEFLPGKTPGLAFFHMAESLGTLLGRRVDLHTPASLSPYFRDRVLSEAEVLFEQA